MWGTNTIVKYHLVIIIFLMHARLQFPHVAKLLIADLHLAIGSVKKMENKQYQD